MRLHLINPNSSASMTATIARAAQRVAAPGTEIIGCTPADGPASIESHFDDAVAAVGVCEEIRRGEAAGADAYVIACFGDPGLHAARELTRAPVIGIAQAAFVLASMVATRFSVVTTLQRTVIMSEHLLHAYGYAAQCRRVRAAEIPVLELEDGAACMGRLVDEARRARDEDGIGAIVLGCAGMADLTAELGQAVGLPVVDGVTAAVKLAESMHQLGLGTSKFGDYATPPAKVFAGRFGHFSS
ncbi:MAG: aspartate/glutamate racemase family protein [Zoogloea sp.]|uniref:aspartate/glutamate racemase family protein n=1 Tax=Zoogloea sp. TaxID=49181 RepID=UPI003F31BF85